MKTLRRPFSIGIVLLLGGVVWLGWAVNVTVATYVLAAGLVGLAAARILLPPKDTLNARGRTFDIAILLGFAVALATLAPWGLAQLPS